MSKYRFASRMIVIGVLVMALGACSIFQRIVDRFAPPATFTDLQYESVRQNLQQAAAFTADVGAYVSAQTLEDILRNEVKSALIRGSIDSIRVDSLETRLILAPQGIIIEVAFDGLELKNRVRVKGSLQGLAAVATVDDRLLLRPSLGHLKLTRLRYEGGSRVQPDIAKLVNATVMAFADNASGYFKDRPVEVKLGWQSELTLNVEELNTGDIVRVNALNRTVMLKLSKSLIHIDRSGLRVLAQVEGTGAPGGKAVGSQSTTVRGSVSERELDRLFKQYSTTFAAKWHERLDPLTAADAIELQVSKSTIAGMINQVSDQNIGFDYRYDLPPSQFNEVVEAKKSQVDCRKIYKPFNRTRYQRASCSWSCQRCVLGMCTNEPVCMSTRAACNIREEARVARDNVEWEAERIQHNLGQEAEVAACNVWRETTSILSVGRFAGDFRTSGKVEATTSGIVLDPALSQVVLKELSATVAGSLDLDMKATPHDLGHVFFCMAPTRLDYEARYLAAIPSSTRQIALTMQNEGDDLVLRARLPTLDYQAGVTPPPIQAFVTSPDFLTKCPFAATILFASVPTAKLASVLGLKEGTQIYDAAMGRYEGSQELGDFEFRLEPVTVWLSEQRSIRVAPAVGKKSIQMRAKPPA